MHTLILEGPFESAYSLAVVNRHLGRSLRDLGVPLQLRQRDGTVFSPPSRDFLRENRDLAPLFVSELSGAFADVHSRYIYPPLTDRFAGRVHAIHCYGWEETSFPRRYARDFNAALDLISVMSPFVRDVLRNSGVEVAIGVTGLGADHILGVAPAALSEVAGGEFVFLHVSSCFPRKAPEVLVEAFCREFSAADDVRLIIKTSENPHNELRRILAAAALAFPRHAPIDVIWRPLGLRELRWLYERAGCLVSASRGEGFGLPVAEAMLLGRPVIATLWSGQAQTCSQENCWPVEFSLEPARSHVTEGVSIWAEPSPDSLRRQMRAVYGASAADRSTRTELARASIAKRFTWRRVAERHWAACEHALEEKTRARIAYAKPAAAHRIGFVTPWNSRCGIAEYSRYLAGSLPEGWLPFIFASRDPDVVRRDEPFVSRCWTAGEPTPGQERDELVRAVLDSGVRAVSIQFNFSFFRPARLRELVERLRQSGVAVAVTLHATTHPEFETWRPAFEAADLCLCHNAGDVALLQRCGARVEMLRQGIPVRGRGAVAAGPRRGVGSFVIACFGFFLPPKGIQHLLHAFALARPVNPLLRLWLLNALYPTADSEAYASQSIALIQDAGLGGSVSVTTDFLDEESVLGALSAADLVVLPYLYSTESASAAVRLPAASGSPLLCSDLAIFDEFADFVHRYPAGDALALANRILHLASDPAERLKHARRQAEALQELAWPAVAARFAELLAQIPHPDRSEAR